MRNSKRILLFVLLVLLVVALASVQAQDDLPEAEIENDEGGPEAITGTLAYTNPFFTAGVSEPLIITEDQTGFVNRDRHYVMPVASQTLGQITSDFFTSPFSYSLTLPETPAGGYSDVDNDGEEDSGIQVFAIAFWTNTWGDAYLEERDLGGGGWSCCGVSTRVANSTQIGEAGYEYEGGSVLVYAPDDEQGFPSGFGEDGFLFTEDDPTVSIPQGWTLVNMDTDPFTFDRSREAEIELLEGEASEADDFSSMSYTEAFDAMIEKFRNEYAFTEFRELDWDALSEEFRPRFEEAEANEDALAYRVALMEFTWAIPDGHVGGPFVIELFLEETDGGLGIAIRDVDDGRTLVNFVLDGGPAAEAGIELGAKILEIDGNSINEVIDATTHWSGPYGSDWVRRLQLLRYVLRFPVDVDVEVTYQNPGDDEPTTVTLMTIAERTSLAYSSFNRGLTGAELPVEYHVLPSGYLYVKIFSFFDDAHLTIQLWERMLQFANQNGIPGIVIDMRQNGGGNGWLADQMAAYFFNEELNTGATAYYDEDSGEFAFDPNAVNSFILPAENLRYNGPVAVMVGPGCASACEFFSYDMTLQDRAVIVGQYPTGGYGGSVEQFFMPEGEVVQFTIGRAVDAEGEIHLEGQGVAPSVVVPVTEESLFGADDVILNVAVEALDVANEPQYGVTDGGEIALGDEVTGEIAADERVQYALTLEEDAVVDITLGEETGQFDTYLRLYDIDGNLLLDNDDAVLGEVFNSELTELEIPADFTVIIEVATFGDTGEGEYTLSVTEMED